IGIDPAGGEGDGRAADHYGLPRDFRLDDGEALREGMVRMARRCVRPEEVGEIVARELLARFQRETNEERQMFARTEGHLFAGDGEQGRRAEAVQSETVSHMLTRVLLILRETLGLQINRVSTR